VFLECSLLYSSPEKSLVLVFLTTVLGIFAGVDCQTICTATIVFFGLWNRPATRFVFIRSFFLFYFCRRGQWKRSATRPPPPPGLWLVCVCVSVSVSVSVDLGMCVYGLFLCLSVWVCLGLCLCLWPKDVCIQRVAKTIYVYIISMYVNTIYVCMYTLTHTHTHINIHMGVDNGLLRIYM
jgi:hypothetical protein